MQTAKVQDKKKCNMNSTKETHTTKASIVLDL